MAGISSSAVNVYTAPSGGSIVTSGSSGAVIYGRVLNNFVETLTGVGRTVTFSYYGRSTISGTRSLTSNGDTKVLTIALPAYMGTALYAVNYNTMKWPEGSGSESWSSNVLDAKANGIQSTFIFSFMSNTKFVKLNSSLFDPASTPSNIEFIGFTMRVDGISVNADTSYEIPDDTGRVVPYWIEIEVNFPENTANVEQSWGQLEILLSNDGNTWWSTGSLKMNLLTDIQ